MSKLLERIEKGSVLVSDGAWGTFLHEMGLKAGGCPELWNVTHRDKVLSIAKSYIDAGSNIILTNSFGGSPRKLQHYGLEERTYELNKAAGEISRAAAGENNIVLGSIGPTGVILMMGEVSEEELRNGFKIQADALISGGVDAICIETMSDMDEALAAVNAVKQISDIDIVCTFTFEEINKSEFKTVMGVSIEHMVKGLLDSGVSVIGTNCGNGFENMIDIVRSIREIDDKVPVLVHANAGMPIFRDNKTFFPETPSMMAERVDTLVNAGANIIGGCCGTTPEHISAIAKEINKLNADK